MRPKLLPCIRKVLLHVGTSSPSRPTAHCTSQVVYQHVPLPARSSVPGSHTHTWLTRPTKGQRYPPCSTHARYGTGRDRPAGLRRAPLQRRRHQHAMRTPGLAGCNSLCRPYYTSTVDGRQAVVYGKRNYHLFTITQWLQLRFD